MSELERRLHRVMGSMIGNESLAASLDNDAASELLLWEETAAKRIVYETDGMDDETAEERMAPRLRALRLMMRAVGRWVGEAGSLDDESRLALWSRMGEQARVIFSDAFILPPMNEILAQLPADSDASRIIVWLRTFIEGKGTNG